MAEPSTWAVVAAAYTFFPIAAAMLVLMFASIPARPRRPDWRDYP